MSKVICDNENCKFNEVGICQLTEVELEAVWEDDVDGIYMANLYCVSAESREES